ncbi:protein kinase domain-containing protein [Halovenus halobia]|uniref:protein kinase domain-containing protein n=1 Tax=Halovenus halobia TaxID=3396622 RepID=UPI003F551EB6
MTTDGEGSPDSSGDGDSSELPPPRERTHPLVSSLCAGLVSEQEMAEQCAISLCLVAENQPSKVSRIIGQLVEQVVADPESEVTVRTLGTLSDEHGREIRGALMTETGYTDARRLYGRVEHAEPWDLSAVETDVPEGEDADFSFVSAVMRLVELEAENRDPLDSDVWTRFIQEMPGEGGESASEEEIELAAAREQSRPRSVRRRHRRIERIANSRLFRVIESSSRFDELEVLSGLRSHRFGKTIRTRGQTETNEYALTLLLVHQVDSAAFRRLLTDRIRAWDRLAGDGVVTVADWGDSPRLWVATTVVGGSLADRDRLPRREALAHAQTLSRALVTIHQHGIVHGGIDPLTVSYPPTGLDSAVEPMLDMVGFLSVYRRFADTDTLLDIRYAAPEQFDEQSVDGATDIYQLGAVLYRALTGRPPYDGDAETVREQILAGDRTPPTDHNPKLPDAVDDIIAKAMATQKLLRYDNATRFHQEIRQLCDDFS